MCGDLRYTWSLGPCSKPLLNLVLSSFYQSRTIEELRVESGRQIPENELWHLCRCVYFLTLGRQECLD